MIEIEKYAPCTEGLKFRKKYPDFKTAWNECQRGDWMLWIAKKLDVDLLKLTTAKALCANTVRHLMKDEKSTIAIDVALSFGNGIATRQELYAAYAAADAAAYAAADAAADAAAYAAAAYAAAAAAYAAADAAYAAAAAAYAAAYAAADAAAYAARIKNRLQTANICREVLTEVVFEAINKLNETEISTIS